MLVTFLPIYSIDGRAQHGRPAKGLCADAMARCWARSNLRISCLRPVGAKAPDVAFRIAADELAAAIAAVGESFLDLHAGSADSGKQRVDVLDGNVERLAALFAGGANEGTEGIVTDLAAHDDR